MAHNKRRNVDKFPIDFLIKFLENNYIELIEIEKDLFQSIYSGKCDRSQVRTIIRDLKPELYKRLTNTWKQSKRREKKPEAHITIDKDDGYTILTKYNCNSFKELIRLLERGVKHDDFWEIPILKNIVGGKLLLTHGRDTIESKYGKSIFVEFLDNNGIILNSCYCQPTHNNYKIDMSIKINIKHPNNKFRFYKSIQYKCNREFFLIYKEDEDQKRWYCNIQRVPKDTVKINIKD